VTPLQIRTEIEALQRSTRPEQRTSYEQALLALASILDQTTAALDGLRASCEQVLLALASAADQKGDAP
jgi:hypothetical protein